MELLVAIALSVSVLTTIGLVFNAETTSWGTAVSKERLQSDVDTVNAVLTTAFQNMNQVQVSSSQREVLGSSGDGTHWDIKVSGQDIVLTKTSASGTKTTKTFHFTNVSLSNSSFAAETNSVSTKGSATATKLVSAKLIAQSTSRNATGGRQSELDVNYAVGSGF